MDTTKKRERAVGIVVLGVPMPKKLKERIKRVAARERRTMADWARLELEKAVKEG